MKGDPMITEDEDLVAMLDRAIDSATVELSVGTVDTVRRRITELEVELAATRRQLAADRLIVDRARAAERDLTQLDETRGTRVMVHGATLASMIVSGAR